MKNTYKFEVDYEVRYKLTGQKFFVKSFKTNKEYIKVYEIYDNFETKENIPETDLEIVLMNYTICWNKFINGEKIKSCINNIEKDNYTGNGIILENDYMVLWFGGSSSGYEFNDSYIISPNGIKIAQDLDIY